jgi:four helix bundle protein
MRQRSGHGWGGRTVGRWDGQTVRRSDGQTVRRSDGTERRCGERPGGEVNQWSQIGSRYYGFGMIAHERLEAWRWAHRLALEVYNATDRWPRSEMYGLTSQARRAAISIPANIAEGAARRGPREFARYLNISLGSLAELSYLLLFSRDRDCAIRLNGVP